MEEHNYSDYRRFLENFYANIDPCDQLPVKVAGYSLSASEVKCEVVDWCLQYLSQHKCPPTFIGPIVKRVLNATQHSCSTEPTECGYDSKERVYQPLKLMHKTTSHVNEICGKLLDNSQLYEIPPPPPSSSADAPPKYTVKAIKNTRKKMEDRHVCIDEFTDIFGSLDDEPTSYYAIFDGHAGQDAASYCVSHLHYYLSTSPKYPSKIEEAMRDAFLMTDLTFLEKAKRHNLNSGSTALSALYRRKSKKIYVGWVGDSKALLVKQGRVYQIVIPHSPNQQSERSRIEKQGGCVMNWGGTWRVNGQLAVSRAIGDAAHKPFVTGEPDIQCIPLEGEEDFLVMGCDGLWDYISEDDVAITIYREIKKDPDNLDLISKLLVDLSKTQGSNDNISVIVIFLKDPHLIASSSWPSAEIELPLDIMETTYDNSNNTFGNVNQDIFQKPSLINEFDMDFISKNSAVNEEKAIENKDELIDDIVDKKQIYDIESNNNPMNDDLMLYEGNGIDDVSSATVSPSDEVNVSAADNVITTDEFGPETDVDAGDENVGNLIIKTDSEYIETMEKFSNDVPDKIDLENPFYNNSSASANSNPFGSLENKIIEGLSLNNPDLKPGNNPFDIMDDGDCSDIEPKNNLSDLSGIVDNKLIDEFETSIKNENFEKYQERILDFSEKKDFSFEREEFEKEFTLDGGNGSASEENAQQEQHHFDNLQFEAPNNGNDVELIPKLSEPETQSIAENKQEQLVADNVGESGGEESEDEWNYIKVNTKKEIIEGEGEAKVLGKEDSEEQEQEQEKKEEEKENEKEQGEQLQSPEERVESPQVVEDQTEEEEGEEKIVKFEEEIHVAVVAALEESAESQEAYIELMQNTDTADLELEKLEESDREKLEENLVEPDGNLDEDENAEEDMMASQLNPEAKEFVPISPQRSAPTSPLIPQQLEHINGSNFINSQLLLKDDAVVAQSPRKGSVAMENIDLPSETEFDFEICKRPHELTDEMIGEPVANNEFLNGNNEETASNYQEMNLKEAMHGDEKQEIGYNDVTEKNNFDDFNGGNIMNEETLNALGDCNDRPVLLKEENTMNMSFYEGRDECILNNDSSEDPNKVQLLPLEDFEDNNDAVVNENNIINLQLDAAVVAGDTIPQAAENIFSLKSENNGHEESDKPESELLIDASADIELSSENKENVSIESESQQNNNLLLEINLDNIKNNIQVEKSSLSPTALEFSPSNKSLASNYMANGSDSSNIFIESLPESDAFKNSSVDDFAESDRCMQNEITSISSAQPSFDTLPSSNEQLVVDETKSNSNLFETVIPVAGVVTAIAATTTATVVAVKQADIKSKKDDAKTTKSDATKSKPATSTVPKTGAASATRKPLTAASKPNKPAGAALPPTRKPLSSVGAKTTDAKIAEKKSSTSLTTVKKPPVSATSALTNGGDAKTSPKSTLRISSATVKSTVGATTSAATKPKSASTLTSKTTITSRTTTAPRPASLAPATTLKTTTTTTRTTVSKTSPTKTTLLTSAKPKPSTPTGSATKAATTRSPSSPLKPRVSSAVKVSEPSTLKEVKPRPTAPPSRLTAATRVPPKTTTSSVLASTAATKRVDAKKTTSSSTVSRTSTSTMKSSAGPIGKKSASNTTAAANATAAATAAAVRSNIIKRPLGKVTTTTIAKNKIDTNGKIGNEITEKHLNGDHITEDLIINNKTTTTLIDDVDNKTFDKIENLNINENLQNIIIDSTTD